ncbi:IclR family transcriptional regulator [Nocardia sp. BMG51109]|uniref:IclR family transcriptional regulator n=1 Tax=Nocardia sp. BMG51109 TaxID=1056816 RepID=UPI00046612CE|nr:IclR family transcriptional regulator [Nocardia sp. BMG51109]
MTSVLSSHTADPADTRLSAQSADTRLPAQSMAERITLIMDVFDRPQTVRTLEEVARRARLPRSTTYRILDQLARLRWVDHTDAGYRLGQRFLSLGGRAIDHDRLRAAAAPVLHELAVRTDLVVHLAVLDGPEVLYLDKIGGRAAGAVPSRVGGRAPAHCTALGKAILAGLEPEHIDRDYPRGLPRRTPRSIADLPRLHHELARIRARNGLAFDDGECAPGIACLGTALRGPTGTVGAVSVVGDRRAVLERLAPQVIAAAQAISAALERPVT